MERTKPATGWGLAWRVGAFGLRALILASAPEGTTLATGRGPGPEGRGTTGQPALGVLGSAVRATPLRHQAADG